MFEPSCWVPTSEENIPKALDCVTIIDVTQVVAIEQLHFRRKSGLDCPRRALHTLLQRILANTDPTGRLSTCALHGLFVCGF